MQNAESLHSLLVAHIPVGESGRFNRFAPEDLQAGTQVVEGGIFPTDTTIFSFSQRQIDFQVAQILPDTRRARAYDELSAGNSAMKAFKRLVSTDGILYDIPEEYTIARLTIYEASRNFLGVLGSFNQIHQKGFIEIIQDLREGELSVLHVEPPMGTDPQEYLDDIGEFILHPAREFVIYRRTDSMSEDINT